MGLRLGSWWGVGVGKGVGVGVEGSLGNGCRWSEKGSEEQTLSVLGRL